MNHTIHTAPPDSGIAVRGKTLPSILYESVEAFGNSVCFYQPKGEEWIPFDLDEMRQMSEEIAAGLRDLGLSPGDRVAFFLESDVYFCLLDMGCLIAGLVSVPIYLTHADDAIEYVIEHSESKCLIVSGREQLDRIAPVVERSPSVRSTVLVDSDNTAALPEGTLHLDDLRRRGRDRISATPGTIKSYLDDITPDTLATIIYTSGTTGVPKGVLLSHENLSFNGLTSFSGMKGYRKGPDGERALSFLPMTHVFARALHYGYLAYGTPIYFTTSDRLSEALKSVRPTVFLSVPRVIEKVYAKIREKGAVLTGLRRKIFTWSIKVAQEFKPQSSGEHSFSLRRLIADKLVYSKWREALGGRNHYVISGGAALSEELSGIFAAAGIQILQGYGLTETSPVIAYNRPHMNRPGTVGVPIPGVEVAIAEDGEIITRGPHIMQGYFKNEEKTKEVIDSEGWLHTGDIGEFSADGYLKITDRKKDLFKLSTGKYVMPQPLEHRLAAEPLIDQAVVTGLGRKFCTALLFPSESAMRTFAEISGLDRNRPMEDYITEPKVLKRFDELVAKANAGMDHWSTIKKYRILNDEVSIENGLLTPTLKIKRAKVNERFADVIDEMYRDDDNNQPD